MRRPFLLLSALFVTAAAGAQSPTESNPGFYLSVHDVDISGADFGDLQTLGTTIEAGRRFGGGLEAGLVGSYASYGRGEPQGGRGWSAGLTGGWTRPAPLGTTFRLRGLATFGSSSSTVESGGIETTRLVGDLSATFGREVPVVGSVRVEPMAGVYAHVLDPMRLAGTGAFAELPPGRTRTETGLQFALPVRFRVLGLDAALTPAVRFEGLRFGRSSLAVPGMGFRLDF